MSLVLEEWRFNIDATKVKIKHRSMCDLIADDLNIHHKKMWRRVFVNTLKVLSMRNSVKLNNNIIKQVIINNMS